MASGAARGFGGRNPPFQIPLVCRISIMLVLSKGEEADHNYSECVPA